AGRGPRQRPRRAGLGLHGTALARGSVTTVTIMGGILERFGVHAVPRAQGFLAWWKQGLAAWLPARWQVLLGLARDRVLLSADEQGLRVQLESAGRLRELARLPPSITSRELDALLG